MILIVIGALCWAWITYERRVQPPSYRSFEQIVGLSLRNGYEILVSPDLPGPYRCLNIGVVVGGGRGRVTAGGASRTYDLPNQAGREYLNIALATRDDRPTYAILYKDRPSPEELEDQKKRLRDSLEDKGP
ncbi:MAG TPA: hypothetical protein VG826_04565 [Pirellulales bacterium]|nr:hypothetical protein [Pirellulales bacterium]